MEKTLIQEVKKDTILHRQLELLAETSKGIQTGKIDTTSLCELTTCMIQLVRTLNDLKPTYVKRL